jgi:hypothetical protein
MNLKPEVVEQLERVLFSVEQLLPKAMLVTRKLSGFVAQHLSGS